MGTCPYVCLRSGLKPPVGLLCAAVKQPRCAAFFEGETPSIPAAGRQGRERNPSFQITSKTMGDCFDRLNQHKGRPYIKHVPAKAGMTYADVYEMTSGKVPGAGGLDSRLRGNDSWLSRLKAR